MILQPPGSSLPSISKTGTVALISELRAARRGFGILATYFKVHSRKIDLPSRIPPKKILPRTLSFSPFLSPLFLPAYPLSLSSISLVLPRLVRTLVRFYVPVNARLLSALDTHARGLLFTVDNGSPATMSAPTIFSYCKAGDCACKNEKSHERERERESMPCGPSFSTADTYYRLVFIGTVVSTEIHSRETRRGFSTTASRQVTLQLIDDRNCV